MEGGLLPFIGLSYLPPPGFCCYDNITQTKLLFIYIYAYEICAIITRFVVQFSAVSSIKQLKILVLSLC